jgi:hypothetical protein
MHSPTRRSTVEIAGRKSHPVRFTTPVVVVAVFHWQTAGFAMFSTIRELVARRWLGGRR